MASFNMPEAVSELLGLNGCSLTYWSVAPSVVLLATFVSATVRYRGVVFYQYYEKRNTRPTRYCTITAYPYEAIIAFLFLVGPRILWALDTTQQAINLGAWERRDLNSPWSWAFIGYFVFFDVIERIMFHKRILIPYYKMKARRSVDVMRIDEEPVPSEKQPLLTPADEEAATAPPAVNAAEQPTVRPTIRARITKLFTVKYPEPKALNVLSQMHMSALIKVILTYTFLSSTALQVCTVDDGNVKDFFDMTASMVPQFLVISGLMTLRFLGLVLRAARFGQREIDFTAVNGCEGRLAL